MMLRLESIISPADAAAIIRDLEDEPFVSGEHSAGFTARQVKNNREISPSAPAGKRRAEGLSEALWKNELFLNLAMPRRIVECIFSRYEPGMSYGRHIDNTIMQHSTGDPIRADMSMTLFLAEPATYDGGELVINSDTAPQKVKLPAGDAILYPTTDYHCVEPVTGGVRHAAVFWIQSMVRDEAKRQILTEMWYALDWLYQQQPPERAIENMGFETLKKARANLYRMWAEV